MAVAVYMLCMLASAFCALLLLREYRRSRARLLLWSSMSFVGWAINNALLFMDLVVFVNLVDLALARAATALVAIERDGIQHQSGLGYPAPPQWAAQARLCDAPPDQMARYLAIGNYNWLGLDNQGRDVLARVIYGFRISVLFGFTLTLVSSIVGIAAGAVQGFYGGLTDLLFQRFMEIWSGLPELYLLIILASVVQPSFWILLGFLLLFSWMGLTGVVRAEFLRGRNLDYVRAARALGVSDARLMARHILPNAMVATLTFMPFILSGSVTVLTSLDFLGFGLPPGSASLGELLAQGKNNLQAPWLAGTGFVVLGGVLTLLVFVGEAVRDAFDPRKLPGGAKA